METGRPKIRTGDRNDEISMRKGLPGLQRIRTLRNVSQEELGARVGMTGQAIGQLELGITDCNTVRLRRIRAVLKCSLYDLFREYK